jgi:hypothetical protein
LYILGRKSVSCCRAFIQAIAIMVVLERSEFPHRYTINEESAWLEAEEEKTGKRKSELMGLGGRSS